MADDLDAVRASIIATYRWHSTLSDEELGALMDAETLMGADEAIAKGFATEKVAGLRAAATLDRRMLSRLPIPEKYRGRLTDLIRPEPAAPPAKPDPKAVVQACKAAGFPELADDLLEEPTLDAVNARLRQAKDARAATDALATEIRGLCRTAKLEDRAEAYIRAEVSVEFVKNELTWITAKLAGAEIDASLPPEDGRAAAASWTAAIAKVQGARKGA
jgi:hypothetical protein